MTARLEQWAPDLARRLRQLDDVADAAMVDEAQAALRSVQRSIPRRTGAMARSLTVDTRRPEDQLSVVSSHPGALHLDTGGEIRPLRARYLVIPLDRSYRAGAGGYVTLPARGGTRAVVTADRAQRIVALLTRSVHHRPTGYLAKAARDHQSGSASRIARRLDRALGVR